MKIVRIDKLRLGEFPNILFVLVRTDEGLVGLGETFFGARAVEAYIHETAAPYLLGRDPLRIDQHAKQLYGYLGYASSGAETRGNSAVDIALWDLFGKVANQPIYQLMGGKSRERVRTYNTCAGYRYVREAPRQEVENWGLPDHQEEGPYEDLDALADFARSTRVPVTASETLSGRSAFRELMEKGAAVPARPKRSRFSCLALSRFCSVLPST